MHNAVLHKSLKENFTRGLHDQCSGATLRKIEVDIKDKDYLDFLTVCIEENLSVEAKIKDIINITRIHTDENMSRLVKSRLN